jgi:hypothetical protein
MRVHELIGKQLTWQKPKFARSYFEMYADQQLVATLEWKSEWRNAAVASTPSNVWRFDRVGFWKPHIEITLEAHEGVLYGTYIPNWSGTQGTLTLASGDAYEWKRMNFWSTQYEWHSLRDVEDPKPLIEFHKRSGWGKSRAEIGFLATGIKPESVDLLVAFGWYLLVLQERDTATATVVT